MPRRDPNKDRRLPLLRAYAERLRRDLGGAVSFLQRDGLHYDHSREQQSTAWAHVVVSCRCSWRSTICIRLHIDGGVYVEGKRLGCFRCPDRMDLLQRIKEAVGAEAAVHWCPEHSARTRERLHELDARHAPKKEDEWDLLLREVREVNEEARHERG